MKNIKDSFIKISQILTKNSIFCFLLSYFSIILIFSTIIQKEINIESVCKKYLYSYIIFVLEKIPIPGGKLVLGLILLSLILKLIIEKKYFKKIGTFLIHFGIIILLIGGFLTTKFSKEGSLLLEYYEKDNFLLKNNYLIVIKDEKQKFEFELISGISYKEKEFEIKVIFFYENFDIKPKLFLIDDFKNENIINFFNIKEIPLFLEQEKNQVIALVSIFKNKENIFLYLTKNESKISFNNKNYFVKLETKNEKLPFKMKLLNAEKISYINTNQAKSYKSKLLIKDNDFEWIFDLEMNRPLRYKGYTFYQTSFIEDLEKNNKIILTVSKDYGKFFPYFSCFIIFIGFLIHIFKFLRNSYEV